MAKRAVSVGDGGTIRVLAPGLEIVRRMKHEPMDLSKYSEKQRKKLTDKIRGSKFNSWWTTERVADFIAGQAQANGWSATTGPFRLVINLRAMVGVAEGVQVASIRIDSDGRYLHAYPVGE
jgi:hypothetical protein